MGYLLVYSDGVSTTIRITFSYDKVEQIKRELEEKGIFTSIEVFEYIKHEILITNPNKINQKKGGKK